MTSNSNFSFRTSAIHNMPRQKMVVVDGNIIAGAVTTGSKLSIEGNNACHEYVVKGVVLGGDPKQVSLVLTATKVELNNLKAGQTLVGYPA